MSHVLSFEGGRVETQNDESVLNALLRAGLNPAFSCKSGSCQTCMLQAESGDIPERAQRVLPPETTFERVVTMAVERGKLGDLLFDNVEGLGAQALARVVQIVEKLPPTQALMAITPLRSIFLAGVVQAARRMTPASAEII